MFRFAKILETYSVPFSIMGLATLCICMPSQATAGAIGLFGVSLEANSTTSGYCQAVGTYSTSAGNSGDMGTSFGAGCNGTSFTAPTQAGLTGATLQTGASTTDTSHDTALDSSSTTADLSSGSLHGYTSSGGVSGGALGGSGGTDAQLWDELTFSIAGASDSTVTDIPVFFAVDGSGDDLTQQEWEGFLQFASHQGFFVPGSVNEVDWGWNLNEGSSLGPPTQPFYIQSSGNISYASDPFQNSINWMTPSSNTIDNLQIEGILALQGPSAVVDLSAELFTRANGGTVDFSNTAAISFQLPDSVTMTSASGTFDTAPEPASMLLCGLALVLFGLVGVRRRRNASPRAAPR